METVIIKIYLAFFSVQFNSVIQLCSTFCNPMDCSTPGFPVHHQLPEFTQTHAHQCHSTISSSVVPFSSHLQFFPASGSFSNKSVLHIRWPKYWSFSFSISPSSEYSGLISFRIDWLDLLAIQETFKSLLQQSSSKASILRPSEALTSQNSFILFLISLSLPSFFFLVSTYTPLPLKLLFLSLSRVSFVTAWTVAHQAPQARILEWVAISFSRGSS